MIRRTFPALAVLLALVLIAVATHQLCAHALAFDWVTAAPAPEAPATAVQLP